MYFVGSSWTDSILCLMDRSVFAFETLKLRLSAVCRLNLLEEPLASGVMIELGRNWK